MQAGTRVPVPKEKYMKHIKTLGLLAVAVMALTAVFGTASASAVPTFTASSGGLKLEESTLANHVFTVTGSNTSCKNIVFEGATEGTDTASQSVMPTYGECTAFGFPAHITVTNCKLVLDADKGTVHLVKTDTASPGPCNIHIEVDNALAKCKVTITEQTIEGAVSYSNGAGDIKVKVNGAANISDHVTESTGFCPLTVGTHTNAHYTGESTVQASGGTISFDP
jgi:hypothetical protein